MWLIKCSVKKNALGIFLQVLESFSTTVSFFEQKDDTLWSLEALCDRKPTLKTLVAQFEVLSTANHIACPTLSMEKLPEKDWLTENYQAFPAIQVGSFFIHGSHIKGNIPKERITLQIDAATAFGTGEHATTHGCLVALEALQAFYTPEKALDMGCGSGILAMAIAKLWPTATVLAVDHDPEAVRVAQENCIANHVDSQVTCFLSEGFKALKAQRSFNLITANILADPLILMAKDISSQLNEKGFIILSGILDVQIKKVLAAYQKQGLYLYKKYLQNNWAILVLQKNIL
ncbi:MAG: 50S ribosomal protein L11 methyltransferase [Alphaproteobacteria bacterium]|nr:50S ribosomal protein L11 methyltransferase [Alphaproteobacteria bacterium]